MRTIEVTEENVALLFDLALSVKEQYEYYNDICMKDGIDEYWKKDSELRHFSTLYLHEYQVYEMTFARFGLFFEWQDYLKKHKSGNKCK